MLLNLNTSCKVAKYLSLIRWFFYVMCRLNTMFTSVFTFVLVSNYELQIISKRANVKDSGSWIVCLNIEFHR